MKKSQALDEILTLLPAVAGYHRPGTPLYDFLKKRARTEIEQLFGEKNGHGVEFGPFGKISFPYQSMGAIDTLNLFDIDELIIFSFYWSNRHRYKKVLDIGANLGLHTIVLRACGFRVTCYEPDPVHFKILRHNLLLNRAEDVVCKNMAVSDRETTVEFVRVLGNTTGSHIAGAKPHPYGKLERFSVPTAEFRKILKGVDFVKMDVEGHERVLISNTTRKDWTGIEGMLSVHDKENARALYRHFSRLGISMYSQKINWGRVRSLKDMPLSHHEGSILISSRGRMSWG